MKRYPWFTVVFVFFIFYCLNFNVFAAKELYDDFSGTYIDSQRWDSREFVREIVSGKLVSKLGNDSGTGLYRNNTAFQNPELISTIKCDITLEGTVLDTGNGPLSVARIGGFFYNTQVTGGATGDIYAGVIIGDRGNGGLETYWSVLESLNDDLDNLVEKGSGTLMDPGTVNRETPYTVTISYDGENGFEFSAGVANDSYSGPARQRAAIAQFKGLGTTVGNEDGGSGIGYASALFDNVYINNETTAYDTFDDAPLDNDYWKESLEIVREISGGKLRINAHADWATNTQGIRLANYDTSYLEAKVAVKSDSWLYPGALAFTRIDGYFYNDSHGPGSGQDYNGYEGNVHAQTRIMFHDDLSMVATAAVFRNDDPDRSSSTKMFSKDFTIPINFDRPYTLSIEFKDSMFTFKCVDNENPPNIETLNYAVVSPAYTPYNEGRWLVSRVYASETYGYMKADFDDVYTAEAVDFCECDLTHDGRCDMQDWLMFGEDWGRTDCNDPGVECECDLNNDGRCDMQDWLLFGENWGRTDCYKIQRHEGPVAYYPFNGNADDESGNGNHGTVNGATLTTDRFQNENRAYSFDGFDDNIDLGTGLGLVNNADHLTIVAWIYPYEVSTAGTWRQYTILGERKEGDNYQFAVMDNALYFSFWTNGSESMLLANESEIEPDRWYFVAVTYDGSLVKFYIDGELIQILSASGNIDGHNSTLFLGSWNGTDGFFDGKLDDIKIFNCALTEWEIQELFNE